MVDGSWLPLVEWSVLPCWQYKLHFVALASSSFLLLLHSSRANDEAAVSVLWLRIDEYKYECTCEYEWVCQCECECSVRVLADDLSCSTAAESSVNSPADRAISLADNLSGISPTGNSLSHLPTVKTYIPLPDSPQGIQIERKLCMGEQSQHNFWQRCEKAKSFHYNGFISGLPRPPPAAHLQPPGWSDNKVNSAYSSSAMAIVFALLLSA